jgi:hypothetical protein
MERGGRGEGETERGGEGGGRGRGERGRHGDTETRGISCHAAAFL